MLAGIITGLQTLLSRITSTRAAYLDKLNITGNVPDGANYTAERASKLDNLDATISSRAPANTALSNSIWTNSRAAKLDNITKPIHHGANITTISQQLGDIYFHYPQIGYTIHSRLDSDNKYGLKVVNFTDTTDTLVDVVNITNSGYILGINQYNSSTITYPAQIVVTIDGNTWIDSGYNYLNARVSEMIHGFIAYSGTNYFSVINIWAPLRFNSSLRVQHRATNTAIVTAVVYTLD